ncbi:MAG: SPOR domain-containing protein [Alcanivoracaceae bacterium]|jgi:hypothetical protein|nr:SPOR domain-containing protein [Alcanivoracaceae bacterium]
MARKDLNFSLEGDFAAEPRPQQKPARRGMRAARTDKPLRSPARAQSIWPALALIMVINLTFIATLVYWFSGGDLRTLTSGPGNPAAPLARLEVQMASLGVRMGELAGALEPQLMSNHQAIEGVAASLQQMQGELAQLRAQMAVLAVPPTVAAKAAKADEWLLNLGSFNESAAARVLVKQCEALGYEPEIIEQTASGKPLYVVALAGFEDRNAAESSAQDIMAQTDLNGLWAWKRD